MNVAPSIKEFKKYSRRNNLIVMTHKFYSDWLTPLSVYYSLRKSIKGESFLLESVEGVEKTCRFSFLGFDPICTFISKDSTITVKKKRKNIFRTKKDPLYELKKIMKSYKLAPKKNLRFFGGFVGYLGYNVVNFYEPVGSKLKDTLGTNDAYFILPKFLIIFDHLTHLIEVLSFIEVDKLCNRERLYNKEKLKLKNLCSKISKPFRLPDLKFSQKHLKVKSNFKKEDFLKAVKKVKKYIKEGDIIQTVISQRFSVKFSADPFKVYRCLRILNPSPYMFYLDLEDSCIAGASPEMLLRCEKNNLTTRPIAGTRKRGKNEIEDLTLQKDLLADPKEKAEHIMLVDLSRNDLGRVSKKASITMPVFMEVEKFSHVMHIVSEVRGVLKPREDIFSSLVSCFPAGTVSGAPKVRAMQIINELEPDSRGIYAGSVGYFSFTNALDTCIIIRTIVFKDGIAYIQAGAGIVADSVPIREYNETVNKAKAQLIAVELSQ